MAIFAPYRLPKAAADQIGFVPSSASEIEIAPARDDRLPGSYIINATDVAMHVAWGKPATADDNSTQVPARGAIDIPQSWTGSISAIWASGATGYAVTHQFTSELPVAAVGSA
jgi:hypothetical protein